MSVRRILGIVVLAGLLAVSAVAPAMAEHGRDTGKGVRFVTFDIALSGANEVPGPGDPDGTGVAQFNIDYRNGVVCYAIAVEGISLPATAAHIHAGPVDVAGPIVVPLDPPAGFGSGTVGVSAACLTGVSSSLLRDIVQHPDQYYANVHTADFPAGAVRGQFA